MPIRGSRHGGRYLRGKLRFVENKGKSGHKVSNKQRSENKKTTVSQSQNSRKSTTTTIIAHHHACRTHTRQVANKIKKSLSNPKPAKNKQLQLHMISELYRRKMSEGLQVDNDYAYDNGQGNSHHDRRKVSWGEESEYVRFDRGEACQEVRFAARHKFSVNDESD